MHTQENSENNSSPRKASTANAEKLCRPTTRPNEQNFEKNTTNLPSQNSWQLVIRMYCIFFNPFYSIEAM